MRNSPPHKTSASSVHARRVPHSSPRSQPPKSARPAAVRPTSTALSLRQRRVKSRTNGAGWRRPRGSSAWPAWLPGPPSSAAAPLIGQDLFGRQRLSRRPDRESLSGGRRAARSAPSPSARTELVATAAFINSGRGRQQRYLGVPWSRESARRCRRRPSTRSGPLDGPAAGRDSIIQRASAGIEAAAALHAS